MKKGNNSRMSDLDEAKKYLIGLAIFLFVWVPFISFIDSKNDNSNANLSTIETTKSLTPEELKNEKCKKVRVEGEKLDKVTADLVADAKRLQRVWIVNEMSKLKDEGKITQTEWGNFYTYTSKPISESRIPILEVARLMDKVVKNGYIKPFLPQNVVEMGTRAALSMSSSDYYVNYPECFSEIDNEMYKRMSELPRTKGAWGKKLESSFQLIP